MRTKILYFLISLLLLLMISLWTFLSPAVDEPQVSVVLAQRASDSITYTSTSSSTSSTTDALSCKRNFIPTGQTGLTHTVSAARGESRDATTSSSTPPYDNSSVIKQMVWKPWTSTATLLERSDNWAITWAGDGDLYAAYGDGQGFRNPLPGEKLSLGFSKIFGSPTEVNGQITGLSGINIISSYQLVGAGRIKKSSSLLAVNDQIYMWERNVNNTGNGHNSRIAVSKDKMVTWQPTEWTFDEFGFCSFINYGKNYEGALDDFVYSVCNDHPSAYDNTDHFILMRVPKDKILDQGAYEFFTDLATANQAAWSSSILDRKPVFLHTGKARRSSITYNPGLKRYFWWQGYFSDDARNECEQFGVFDAEYPWGPWTIAYEVKKQGDTTDWEYPPGDLAIFPQKWISEDGLTMYLAFSAWDTLSVRKATIELHATPEPTNTPTPPGNGGLEKSVFLPLVSSFAPKEQPIRTLNIPVIHPDDDAEQHLDGNVVISSEKLDMVETTGKQTVGIRFIGLNMPAGSTIISARIRFESDARSVGEAELFFRGEASDAPARFRTSRKSISRRPQTSAEVAWRNIPEWPDNNILYWTPDLSPIVQELVDRPGWQQNGAMVFIITGDGIRVAASYEGDADGAAVLRISYQAPPPQ